MIYYFLNRQSIKPTAVLLLLFIISFTASGQTKLQTVNWNDTTYYVYPFRVPEHTKDVPLCALKLPDGKYIAYRPYEFKYYRHKPKKLIVKDTNLVSVVFHITSNMPDGDAFFYASKKIRPGDRARKLAKWNTHGEYRNGERNGVWIKRLQRDEIITHYRNGFKDGTLTSKNHRGYVEEGTYAEGKEKGRFIDYNFHGKISRITCYNEKSDTVMAFRKGRLRVYYDIEKNKKRQKQDIWYTLFNQRSTEDSYDYSYLLIPYTDYSFLKTYDKKGRLMTDIRFKNDSTYQFDTIICGGYKHYVTVLPPDSPSDTNHIYVFARASLVPEPNESPIKTFQFYRHNKLFKSIDVFRYGKDPNQLDTMIHMQYGIDTLKNPFVPQLYYASFYKGDIRKQSFKIPAFDYSYDIWSDRSFQQGIPQGIDTVLGIMHMRDSIKSRDAEIYLDSKISKPKNRIALPCFSVPGFYPIAIYKETRLLSDPSMHNRYPLHLNRTWKGDCTSNPELFYYKGQPYSGKVDYSEAYRTRKKKDVIRLFNYQYNLSLYVQARGCYKQGLRDGRWEFSGTEKRLNTKRNWLILFQKKKRIEDYYCIGYDKGYKNGPFDYYTSETERFWDNRHKRKTVTHKFRKFHAQLVNDSLEGEVIEYNFKGLPRIKANYHHGMLDGPYKQFEDSILIVSAGFRNDKLHGDFIGYNQNWLHTVALKIPFNDGMVHGLMEFFSGDTKWLEIKADSNMLRYKKLFYTNGVLKEHFILEPESNYQMTNRVSTSDNFFEYANLPDKRKNYRKLVDHDFDSNDYPEDKEYLEAKILELKNDNELNASYKSYFDNGNIYSEGAIRKFKPSGKWHFYNVNGTLINEITFKDSLLHIKGDTNTIHSIGILTGYYANGKPRCKSLVTAIDVSYDCNSKTDKSAFETILIDNYDYYDGSSCRNGNGYMKEYNENGLLIASGEMSNYAKTGLWKYYDPNQKLHAIGHYKNNQKEGVWYEGDLEGINYEDAACFDLNNPGSLKKMLKQQKILQISTQVYKQGNMVNSDDSEINMNRD
ncbi:MAG: hypothetical protein JST26_17825 [Bacteroidetes bacterium]|nr:hypothetical protein [Bacteroidota bacterium]